MTLVVLARSPGEGLHFILPPEVATSGQRAPSLLHVTQPHTSLLRLRDTASKRSPGLTFLFYSMDFTDRMETHTSLCQSSTIATFSAVCGTVRVTLKSSAL